MRVDLDPRSGLLQYRKMNTIRKSIHFEAQLNLENYCRGNERKLGTDLASVEKQRKQRK